MKRRGSRERRHKRDIALLFHQQGGICIYCLNQMNWEVNSKRQATLDHRTPRGLGGGDEIDNLHAACLECNQKKKMLTEGEFFARLARMPPPRCAENFALVDALAVRVGVAIFTVTTNTRAPR